MFGSLSDVNWAQRLPNEDDTLSVSAENALVPSDLGLDQIVLALLQICLRFLVLVAPEVSSVLHVLGDGALGVSVLDQVALFDPKHAGADGLDGLQRVADEENAASIETQLIDPSTCAVLELSITGVQCFIDDQNLRIDTGGDGELESRCHSG